MLINVTPVSFENAVELSKKNINAIIVGEKSFGIRLPFSCSKENISKLKKIINKKIYVAINGLFFDSDKKKIEEYILYLNEIKIDGIIFSDLMVLEIVKKIKVKVNLIYSTETTITNYYFSHFFNKHGVENIDLAKELTLNEIKEIASNKVNKVHMNIHGHIYMYHSARPLIENYEKFIGEKIEYKDKNLFLFDSERNAYYPIVEDMQGTHILSSKDLCTINHLEKIININLDEVKIDGYGYSESDVNKIVDLYIIAFEMISDGVYEQNKSKLLEEMKEINKNKHFSTGFLFRKTTY